LGLHIQLRGIELQDWVYQHWGGQTAALVGDQVGVPGDELVLSAEELQEVHRQDETVSVGWVEAQQKQGDWEVRGHQKPHLAEWVTIHARRRPPLQELLQN